MNNEKNRGCLGYIENEITIVESRSSLVFRGSDVTSKVNKEQDAAEVGQL